MLLKYVSPGYMILKQVLHIIVEWFEVMKTHVVAKYLQIWTSSAKIVHLVISYFFPSNYRLSKKRTYRVTHKGLF